MWKEIQNLKQDKSIRNSFTDLIQEDRESQSRVCSKYFLQMIILKNVLESKDQRKLTSVMSEPPAPNWH